MLVHEVFLQNLAESCEILQNSAENRGLSCKILQNFAKKCTRLKTGGGRKPHILQFFLKFF